MSPWPAERARRGVRNLVYGAYERRLHRQVQATHRRPRHVGVIMDGNRRWAREAGFSDVSDGHRAGASKIIELLGWCEESGVEVVTFWLLSPDNLRNRPADQLTPLLEIITDVVDKLCGQATGWQVRLVGALDVLPSDMAARLNAATARTANRSGLTVNVAVGYGGRQEIVHALRALLLAQAEAGRSVAELAEDLDPEDIAEYLYTSGQPDPDLLIRTSGEQRLSGFLLWQSAHSEFWFCQAHWPDFRKVDFLRALRDYAVRHRRFGS